MEKNSTLLLQGHIRRPMYQLWVLVSFSLFATLFIAFRTFANIPHLTTKHHPPYHASSILSRCKSLKLQAGPQEEFFKRSESDRFVPNTKPVLIKRAKIWTGRKNGTRVVHGDILLDKGLIKSIGHLRLGDVESYGDKLLVIDAKDAWVTPGIVDVHSHLGDAPSPGLDGAEDVDSLKGTIQPWLRSLDGLNSHDESYLLSVAGGVTTSLILPGSANAIGGQAFVVKLRQTSERSPSSMLLEPPYHINNSFPNPNLPLRWRHMKHACGENPSSVYKDTRMDTNWAFREAYKKASQIKERQDEYCARALAGKWQGLGEFPDELQWEALVDVVRGRVKVNAHCYEAVDLDNLVRLSNEFKFPIAAFHHASEAYLVPELIKQAYGKNPAIALFATAGRYKREAYRSSEFAPRVLAQHGLKVVMKSDHPLQNSRYLLYEAQQAHYYGFPENLAIASVTSNSAEVMGMGHRIGYIKEGWDADLVIWDSHPLALGATPSQVFIDGIPQLDSPHVVKKPASYQRSPRVPKFRHEADEAVRYEGLPPLIPRNSATKTAVFTNVKAIFKRRSGVVQQVFSAQDASTFGTVVVQNGTVVCSGVHSTCSESAAYEESDITTIDLEGGSIAPGLVSFGSPLGLQHIDQEPSTTDGDVFDPLSRPVPKILGGDTAIIRAADGLLYGSRDALLAYRVGVTKGITAPSHSGFYVGLGVSFSLGAVHKLEEGAISKEVTAVHTSVRHLSKSSVSTQIGALRRLLLGPSKGSVGNWFQRVKEGEIPLVIEAHSADIIATLIILKQEVEVETRKIMKMTITGGAEAHLLARELAEAGVGVILNPVRPFPYVWEDRRILPGPPLTKDSAIMKLILHGVTVGIGCEEIWQSRNLPFDVAWVAIEAGGRISKEEAIAIGSTNVEKLLGAEVEDESGDLVATQGGDLLETSSKVVAVISPVRQVVHIIE
ncbi:carbohydrate esterase family 9 protein [Collybia nuda]|uniref:Carbohydrate esterase family 9 protein n=1 Tax=Collybia nuda TaxID=64659 RepID=A0A9P5Y6B8_9AGAR|nr:carbohydrate esterase family 9 protein [Collybia nuda]